VEFARIFAATSWYSFDVNKHLPENALGTVYELTAETLAGREATPEVVFRQWAPVPGGQDPATGFRDGIVSAFWGSAPPGTMQPGIHQDAFLLLATSNYVHLSASRDQSPPLVRGAISETGEEFRYVELAAPSPHR
jgi:hypothetical protein